MNVNSSKLFRVVIVCVCFLLAARPSLAESRSASTTTIDFYHPSCRVPELAPFKLQSNGVPRLATPSIWWYIVLNFNSVTQQGSGQRIQACLRVGNEDGRTIAKAIVCETVGDVRVRRGIATFNGGTVECEGIDVGAAGKEIGIPISNDISVKNAPTFWMAVKGSLSPKTAGPVPLLRYESVVTTTESAGEAGNIAFNLMPASGEQRPGLVPSESPRGNVQGPGLTIAVSPTSAFTGMFETVPIRPAQTDSVYAWSVFGTGLTDALPVAVPFTSISIDESKLTIGGSPAALVDERFHGTLDFVVLDPDGGGRGG